MHSVRQNRDDDQNISLQVSHFSSHPFWGGSGEGDFTENQGLPGLGHTAGKGYMLYAWLQGSPAASDSTV